VSLDILPANPSRPLDKSSRSSSEPNSPKVEEQTYTLWSSDSPDATLERSFSSLQELLQYFASRDITPFDSHKSGDIHWSHLLGHNGILVKGDRHPARRSTTSLKLHAHTSFGKPGEKLEGALEVSAATRIPVGSRSNATAWLHSEIEPPSLTPARIEGGVALTRRLTARGNLSVSAGAKGVVEPSREGEGTRGSAALLAGVQGKSVFGSSSVVRYGAMAQVPVVGNSQGYGAARLNVVSSLSQGQRAPALEFDGVVTTTGGYQIAAHYLANSNLKLGFSYSSLPDEIQEDLHLHLKAVKGLGLNVTARLGRKNTSPVMSLSGSPFGEGVRVGVTVPVGSDAGVSKPFLPHIDPLPLPPELPVEAASRKKAFTLYVATPTGSFAPLKNLSSSLRDTLSLKDIRVKTDSGAHQPLKRDTGGDGSPSLFYRDEIGWIELVPDLVKMFLEQLKDKGVKVDASDK
jgi:hypothetical protein